MNCRLPTATILREPAARLVDAFGRQISYLRLSVTDRCNLRCFYCMGGDVKFLPKGDILSLEELERLAAAFARLGVRKIRLTGGEPLARPGVMGLVERLGAWVGTGDLDELTLTTNGTLLGRYAGPIAAAGVRRLNVSLDTLDGFTFHRIAQQDGLSQVVAGIAAARGAGLAVRVNVVALGGINDAEFDHMVQWCGDHGCDMALIEVMPFGRASENYLPLNLVRERLGRRWTLEPLGDCTGGPARYWRVGETGRRLAFITPMSRDFCASCNRVRLTCTGRLVLCLGQEGGVDLRPALRGCDSDERLEQLILDAVAAKPAGHLFANDRTPATVRPMWQVGG